MFISIMRIGHLRQADLNLLVVFTVVAEERNITRAASRLLLSQPAVTRALQRLRDTFHDDLLIRTSTGYEPTPTGQRLLQDLATMLPRLDRLMAGGDFDPVTEDASFRIAATDHGAYLLVPPLFTSVLPKSTKIKFSFVPLHAGQYEALEKGRLDLVLNADHDTPTAHLSKEFILKWILCASYPGRANSPGQLLLSNTWLRNMLASTLLAASRPIPTGTWLPLVRN